MLKNQEEYKYLPEFYQTAYISPDNIVLQDIDIFGSRVSIFIVEQKDNIRIIKADGNKDKPISWNNIKDMILGESQIEQLLQLQKK
ncbi:hypothetical protein ACFHWD_16345 [Clostridium sp. MT-14]|uniref:hypothetical protein n=1 Tax=Clostridium sp. MT-14 TaxID=3348360 RepID=UPI0035F3632A